MPGVSLGLVHSLFSEISAGGYGDLMWLVAA